MRWVLGFLLWLVSAVATPAAAQSETIVVTSSELRLMSASETEAQAAKLEQAYRDTQAIRPRRGLIASSAFLVGGAGLFAGGLALSDLCFGSSPCPNGGGVGAAALGAALLAGGAVGVGISALRLKRAKEGKRRSKWGGALP